VNPVDNPVYVTAAAVQDAGSERVERPKVTFAKRRVYGRSVDVTLLYFDGCPNWEETDRHLRVLAEEFPDMVITRVLVESPEEADRVGFRGSPSVLIDGTDPFSDQDAPAGLSCRVYPTPDGLAGSPTLEQLREALSVR